MSRFRVGLVGTPIHARYSPDNLFRADYMTALAAGADSFWIPDHLNALIPRSLVSPEYFGGVKLAPNLDAWYEPWTTLGYLAALNRLPRLRLGTAVTETSRRNPAVTAQAAVTLHHLTRGRAILGIGTGEREGNEPYGVDWTKPVARFEEAMATIRALWDSRGELVNRDSPYFPLRDALFELPPYRGKWPGIWVAAHGPRMLRAVGRYADAWLPVAILPSDYAPGLEAVRTAASDAGRDPLSITPAAMLSVVTGFSQAHVEETLESPILKAWLLVMPGPLWARHGAEHPMGADFGGMQDIQPFLIDEQTALSYVSKVPTSLIKEVFLTGTPKQIVEQVAERRDQGLRYLVTMNKSVMQPNLRRSMTSTVPYIKVLRGLRKL